MYVGLEEPKSRKVRILPPASHEITTSNFRFLDQLLELHTNLTLLQRKLLDILESQLKDIEERDIQHQNVRKQWNEFTGQLEESFNLIAMNTTDLMRDVITGLLRLQSFTKDSTRFVVEEIESLEGDVKKVRGEIRQFHEDIEMVGRIGVSKVEGIAELSQQRLLMVYFSS